MLVPCIRVGVKVTFATSDCVQTKLEEHKMVITLKPQFRNIPTEYFTEIDSYVPSMHIGSAPILIEGRPHHQVHPHLKIKSHTPATNIYIFSTKCGEF